MSNDCSRDYLLLFAGKINERGSFNFKDKNTYQICGNSPIKGQIIQSSDRKVKLIMNTKASKCVRCKGFSLKFIQGLIYNSFEDELNLVNLSYFAVNPSATIPDSVYESTIIES